jgi:hypothetical protein
MSPTLRSSNVLGSTTVKVAGSNWPGPEAVGWVIAGAPYVEMEWSQSMRQSRCGEDGDASPAIAGRYMSSALIPVA